LRYKCDGAVLARVKELADGRCECCGADAPFVRPDGTKFLEHHHVRPLSEGGPDYVSNSVMLCPNCHRAIHFSREAKRLKRQLFAQVSRLRAYPAVDAGADAA
jgi:5-methylcytosine-specific restriction protein A